MKQQLENIEAAAKQALADCGSIKGLDDLRVRFLGKKGELTGILKQMGGLSAEERPVIGQLANKVRGDIEAAIGDKLAKLKAQEQEMKIRSESIDITLPGKPQSVGKLHPLTIVANEVKEIFLGMGFSVADGPEVEYDYYNFEALNLPPNHPARDTQDTFYITDNILLRTQTSSVQVHVMENQKPPIRIISPGRVYRSDAVDATHSPLFHQIEGLVVDKGVTMADLKGTLELLMKRLYGDDCKIRLRPHHFPFTEPSARWMSCASTVTEKAAASARVKAILNCWAPAWFIPRYWKAAASTARSTPALPLVWVWSGSLCAGTTSATCV